MYELFITVAAVFVMIIGAEILWRMKKVRDEPARKLVHILVGIFAGSWAFYMNDAQIYILCAAMLGIVFISKSLHLFRAIHSVERKTWGELFFPLGIAAAAGLSENPWVLLAAMLHVSLADGLAALVGRQHVRKHGYKVFSQQKTVVGTLTFFNVSLLIVAATMLFVPEIQANVLLVLLTPLLATVAENAGLYGSDDLLVPLSVVSLFILL